MNASLLLMSIGPVQDFIAQARRTRDLWFGSHVLSEISRAAARALTEHGAELIFPALDNDSRHLEPRNAIRDDQGERPYNVANRILARVPGDARQAATVARNAAGDCLRTMGEKTFGRTDVRQLLGPDPDDARTRAVQQLGSLLEIHVLWTELHPGRDDGAARQQLEDEMAARKTFYTFAPWSHQRGGLHKSSLDGARETVLRPEGRDGKPWRRYQIGLREELDGVGLLKRTGGESEQFIPLPNIGLGPWLVEARTRAGRKLDDLAGLCEEHDFTPVRSHDDHEWIQACPFDAQLFLPERWQPYLDDYGLGEHFSELARLAQRVLDAVPGPPYPYVACVVADGDHMGKAIDLLARKGMDALRAFSAELARFAGAAQHIVEREHHGVLVYAGGDDVLAFVCPQQALSCARALSVAFTDIVSRALADAGVTGKPPTLSVGIGIGHVLQSMGRLLGLGRDAEKMAKHEPRPDGHTRNALAVIFERHSGTVRRWHQGWDQNPCECLDSDRARVQPDSPRPDALSMGKIHEIEDALRRAPEHDPTWLDVLCGEVKRILARTEAGGEQRGVTPGDVGLTLQGDYKACRTAIDRWVQRMLIAGELMRAHESIAGTDRGTIASTGDSTEAS